MVTEKRIPAGGSIDLTSRCNLSCVHCPGWSEIETGSGEKPSDFLCRLAYLRNAAYGDQISAHDSG